LQKTLFFKIIAIVFCGLSISACMDRTYDFVEDTPAGTAPFAGAKSAVDLDGTRIQISWAPYNVSSVSGFRVYEYQNDGALTVLSTVGAGSISYTHTGLTACTVHNYVVRALMQDGSLDSNLNIVTAMTFAGATSVTPQLSGAANVNFPVCANASTVRVYCKTATAPAYPAAPSATGRALAGYVAVSGGFSMANGYVCMARAVQSDTGVEDSNTKTVNFAECPGLLAYWDADGSNTATTTVTDRASTNNGTFANGSVAGTTDTATGSAGVGFSFNGTNQYVTVPTANALNVAGEFTISLWLKSNKALPNSIKTSSVLNKSGYNNAAANFSNSSNWSGVDMTSALALNNGNFKGYSGGVFDGRYIYFIPYNNGAAHGNVARFDTQGSITSSTSWVGIDISSAAFFNNASYRGYMGGVFDGRYVYLIPYSTGMATRYDTQMSFTDLTAWSGIDLTSGSAFNSASYKGYSHGVFDGRYVYYTPCNNGAYHGLVVRYDTQGTFTQGSSWQTVDMTSAQALNSASYIGYDGAVFDGRYVYFVPYYNTTYHGYVARYDTQGPLTSSTSWTGIDVSSAAIFNNAAYRGFARGIFDGRYVYFVPYINTAYDGYIARYDIQGAFTSVSSWTGVDISSASVLNNVNYRGFQGAIFDGRYLFLVPYYNGTAYDAYAARYDTTGSLTSASSWTGVDFSGASIFNNALYHGYYTGVYDGRYAYFVPYYNNTNHGNVVRYDTSDPAKRDYSLTTGGAPDASTVRFRLETDTGSFLVRSGVSVAANTWFHVAVRYSKGAGFLKMYINGTEADSTAASGTPPSSVADLLIGRFSDGGAGYFSGVIDEVMLFDHALLASEITTLANPVNVCK
jgi:antitoxin component YwqK of YwqJK toxin-antitoxin module